MSTDMSSPAWVITGFQSVVLLWAWGGLVLLHAVWRSLLGAETDPIRQAGPIE